jgi:hypothetical protein
MSFSLPFTRKDPWRPAEERRNCQVYPVFIIGLKPIRGVKKGCQKKPAVEWRGIRFL